MTTITESTTATVNQMQGMLTSMTALVLTDYLFPTPVELNDNAIYDFVVVGSGAGGSVIASRLTEDDKTTVALIEAGGIPPLESKYTGLFPLLVNSKYDWNITSTDDCNANQNLQNNIVEMTTGKMLGGTSSLDHVIINMANKYDMERFANATGDQSYNLKDMLKYYIKSGIVFDKETLAKCPSYYGTKGPLVVRKDHSDKNANILTSFKELGNDLIVDINANKTIGYSEPLFLLDCENRQSSAATYLRRAKNRHNLYVQINALVTKIIINSSNIATGVQILTSDGTYKTINARKEVIVSAGALKSPQLLMLSGIGEKSHLEKMNITVKIDLPVGNNLIDHSSTIIGFKLQKSNETVDPNRIGFPAPVTTGSVSLDGTKDPTYQSINLYIGPNYDGLMQICVWLFKYKNSVCEALYEANEGRALLLSVVNFLHPESRGTVRLNSKDPTVNPTVYLNYLSNPKDLDNFAKSLQDIATVVNTTYFQKVGSKIVEFDLPECDDYEQYSFDYWKCYGKSMSATAWHYCSTCAIGKVLDNNMMVKGMMNLRVVDASAMPYTVSGKIIGTIYAIAEKAADLIKNDWNLC